MSETEHHVGYDSKNRKYSVLGPLDDGRYSLWNHHDGEEIDRYDTVEDAKVDLDAVTKA